MSAIKELTCKLCGHKWYPRKPPPFKPKVCPNHKCGSTNWATGRKRPPLAEQHANAAKRKSPPPSAAS